MSNSSSPGQKRAYALDALRGIAILMMVLSGIIPWTGLPTWMYHAQVPPPDHVFNPNLAGITWVDLVFPFFLFSMGAAIPMALTRRIEDGVRWWKLVWQILIRGLLLVGFAVYIEHVRPQAISSSPTTQTYLLALLGFALLFPVLIRLPSRWDMLTKFIIRAVGWAGAVALVVYVSYPGKSISTLGYADLSAIPNRNDIIILVLANMAVFGSLIWMITRNNLLLRLGFLGIMMAIRMSGGTNGWVQQYIGQTSIPWLYLPTALQYLHIIIPGTIAGDMILKWMASRDASEEQGWSRPRMVLMSVLMFAVTVVMVIGLKERWLWQTTVVGFAVCGLGWWLFSRPSTSTEKLLNGLFTWGAYWLILGLIFEPYEGGIKKDSATMSYYYVTSGLAVFTIIAFTIMINVFHRKRWLQLLIDNGQNPMIAYAGMANLVVPLMRISGLGAKIEQYTMQPWPGAGRAALMTLLLALIVSLFTRLKIFWRT